MLPILWSHVVRHMHQVLHAPTDRARFQFAHLVHIDHNVLGLGFVVDQIGDRRVGLSESAKMEGA